MAGDIGRRERVIVLPESTRMDAAAADARAALDGAGAGTTHEYGDRVVVVDLPQDAEEALTDRLSEMPAGDGPAADADAFDDEVVDGLDEAGALGLAAFGLRSSDAYAQAKASRPHAGEDWDQPGGDVLPPDPPPEIAALIEGLPDGGEASTNGSAFAGAPASSARLMGSVAVGIIIVEGPSADLKFSQAERVKVVAEVQNGLGWLGAQSSPQGIRWVYDVRVVTITAQPAAADDDLPKREARFRDPALRAMGYGPGVAGAQSYVNALRTAKGTNWAYCSFFTKYPVGHFAYASLGGPRLVMHYDNDGWTPDGIDRVHAHETGHIFNAPDEYASSGCNCGGQWGHFKVANANCDPCSSNPVACIMKANTWAMCSYTPYHLGFPQGARYTGVYVGGSGAHAVWTNASWDPFVAKWQQLSNQGLRLVDLDITRIGNQLRYSGAFRAGSGRYGLWALANYASFREKWLQWSGQGMRLVDLEITQVGNETRYSGVFGAGSGSYGLWVNAPFASFEQKWKEWSAQGLRLVDLAVRMEGNSPRYSGVFQQGTGSYALWALATWQSFHQKWQQWSQQGLRLVDLERTMVGGQARFSGVFRQGTGGYGLWTNSSWQAFLERYEQWTAGGLRLVDLSVEPTGIEAVASPQPGGADLEQDLGLAGLLGFGGAAIPVAVQDGGSSPGEGVESLVSEEPEEELDAVGVGIGDVSFTGDDGRPTADRLDTGQLPVVAAPIVLRVPAEPTAEPSHTGMGGASLEGTHAATVSVPADPSTAGQGELVLVDVTDDEAPAGVGVGGHHEGN